MTLELKVHLTPDGTASEGSDFLVFVQDNRAESTHINRDSSIDVCSTVMEHVSSASDSEGG